MKTSTVSAVKQSSSQLNPAILNILKWLLLAAMLFFIFTQLFSQHQSSAVFDDVSAAVLSAADLSTLQEADNQMLRRVFNLNSSDYDGILYYAPLSNMDSTEILLVKLSDLSQQEQVKTRMEDRISSQISVFEGYAPDQVELLEHAVITVSGNYLLLVVAQDPAPVVAAFKAAL